MMRAFSESEKQAKRLDERLGSWVVTASPSCVATLLGSATVVRLPRASGLSRLRVKIAARSVGESLEHTAQGYLPDRGQVAPHWRRMAKKHSVRTCRECPRSVMDWQVSGSEPSDNRSLNFTPQGARGNAA